MKKVDNPESVAATLTAAVIQKYDFGQDSKNIDAILHETKQAFLTLYGFISEMDIK